MSDEPAPAGRAPVARIASRLVVFFVVLHVLVTRGNFVGVDEIVVYDTTRSLWEGHGLAVPHSTPQLANTFEGRGGHLYGVYNAGQSVAALPLYGLGTAVRRGLERAGWQRALEVIAGPGIGNGAHRWGGTVEIFFVNLFNAFVNAILYGVFFAFSVRLGASPRWAVAATLLLGLTTYVAPFATGFLQHSSEALFLLLSAYFLYRDAQEPRGRLRLAAGVAAGLGLSFRFPSAVGLPPLGLYLLASAWRRPRPSLGAGRRLAAITAQALPFVLPVGLAVAAHIGVNACKFGTWHPAGRYAGDHFSTPLLVGLHGLLASPGESIFVFTPLLVLLPWTFTRAWLGQRALAAVLLGTSLAYLLVYAKLEFWHGLWSALGPRYLMPIVPLLLLPLGGWMEERGRRAWFAVAPLALAGLWVQVVHVACNFGFVYNREGYPKSEPPFAFLFLPDRAPLVAQSRALLSGDGRVDTWLVNTWRNNGVMAFAIVAVPLAALLATAAWRLWRATRALEVEPPAAANDLRFIEHPRRIAIAAGVVVAATLAGAAIAALGRPAMPAPTTDVALNASPDDVMGQGLTALYSLHDPARAAALFAWVVDRSPDHLGANFQLARSLEAAGRPRPARAAYERAQYLAEGYLDQETASLAREALARIPRR